MKELTIGDLIDELEEYPRDTPVWPQLHIRGIFMMLDFEFSQYHSLDGGNSQELHLVFKKSEIYDSKGDVE